MGILEGGAMGGELEAVKKVVVVNVPVAFAFEIFTERMGSWWPETHHIGKEKFVAIVMEKRSGGRMFEKDAQGVECEWGKILLWEPPKRVKFSWNLQPDWKFDADMGKASEVEITFVEEAKEKTRVELVHRNLERHGAGWENLRAGVDSPGGWTAILESYVRVVNGN